MSYRTRRRSNSTRRGVLTPEEQDEPVVEEEVHGKGQEYCETSQPTSEDVPRVTEPLDKSEP